MPCDFSFRFVQYRRIAFDMTAYENVRAARDVKRPTALDYIENVFDGFAELHGDRLGGDDPAVIAGIALLGDQPVTVIGLEKGRSTEERVKRNFGAAQPEGYRKAARQLKLAEKFRRPAVCLIDTSGANCGVDAERHGQSAAIAECIACMTALRVPVISIVIGEGGSGGAVALASGDELWMISGSYYSVVSPESCANILWKDASRAAEAAECLRLTAADMLKFGVAERIIGEGNLTDPDSRAQLFSVLRPQLSNRLSELSALDPALLLERRREKFARF